MVSPQNSVESGSSDYQPQLQKRYKVDQFSKLLAWIATLSGIFVLLF
jgi:hypothetical protein